LIDIRDAIRRGEIKPNYKLGQYFLTDNNIAERIVSSAGLTPGDHVIEVGPGVCALTGLLCGRARSVTAVEIDRRLTDSILASTSGYDNFRLVNADALTVPTELLLPPEPGAPAETRVFAGPRTHAEHVVPASHPRVILVSNMPYYISTPIMTRIAEDFCFVDRAVLMMQREVSEKLLAKPSEYNYCVLTVIINALYSVKRLFTVPPHCFTPQPGVESAVVLLEKHTCGNGVKNVWRDCERAMFFQVVRAAFARRRKTLENSLIHAGLAVGRAQADEAVARAGIDAGARGESLDARAFAALARALLATPTGGFT